MTSYWYCSIRANSIHIEVRKGGERGRHTCAAGNSSQGKHGTNLHPILGAFHLKVNTDSFTTQSYVASCYSSRTPQHRGRKHWIIQTEWSRELGNMAPWVPRKRIPILSLKTKARNKENKIQPCLCMLIYTGEEYSWLNTAMFNYTTIWHVCNYRDSKMMATQNKINFIN
jgi:hypothetical protein